MSVLLDSTVVIDLLRGAAPARAYLEGLDEVPTCSEITRVEVVRGLRTRERATTERLLRTFNWEPVDEVIARAAGELGREHRRSHPGLASADLIIGATALTRGLELATSNLRHFPMFPGLKAPYRL